MKAQTQEVQTDTSPLEPMVDVHDVAKAFKVKTNAIYKMIASGQLPAPVRIGGRAVRWKASVIQAKIDSFESSRDESGKSTIREKQLATFKKNDTKTPTVAGGKKEPAKKIRGAK